MAAKGVDRGRPGTRTVSFWEPAQLLPQVVVDMLSLVGVTLPLAAVEQLTDYEQLMAYDWAAREHFAAAGNIVWRRPKPWFVRHLEQVNAMAERLASDER